MENDGAFFVAGLFLGGLVVGFVVESATQNEADDLYCPAILAHAETASDTLAVYVEFEGCFDHVRNRDD